MSAAFPGPSFTQGGHPNWHDMGMSLRDWFAGRATQADIDHHQVWARVEDGAFAPDCSREQAKYRYADAMLEARK